MHEASLPQGSLVPRLFLVEERAWQHWGVGAVYFRYVMVHVIYSIDYRDSIWIGNAYTQCIA